MNMQLEVILLVKRLANKAVYHFFLLFQLTSAQPHCEQRCAEARVATGILIGMFEAVHRLGHS